MSRYPDNWDQIRKRVYRRDNYTCQKCGDSDTEIHAHHITPISQGGGHHMENLTTLCKGCHEDVHGRPIGGGSKSRRESKGFWFAGIVMGIGVLFVPPLSVIGLIVLIISIFGLLTHEDEGKN